MRIVYGRSEFMQKIKDLWKQYQELINYLIFGVLTTLVNIVTFYLLTMISVDWQISNMIAWITSVLFAYITNKLFVFESKNNNIVKELVSFISFRLLSLGIDMICMYLFIDILSIPSLISKIIVNVIVVILNYVFSKLFIFKEKE